MLSEYLSKIGFNEKQIKIYLTLAEFGSKPASIIAKKCGFDRVTTYKNAKKLVSQGFLKIYYKNGIQCFGIESFNNLKTYINEKKEHYKELSDEFNTINNVLKSLKKEENLIPRLEVFEGKAGIKRFFRDLLFELKSENVSQVRMLTSNTFQERLGKVELSKFISEFYNELQKEKIDLEIFEASGNLIPERLTKIIEKDFDLRKLPAARGTTHIFIAGYSVYLACYKDSQIGLKIKQNEISQMFHFIFDILSGIKKSPTIIKIDDPRIKRKD